MYYYLVHISEVDSFDLFIQNIIQNTVVDFKLHNSCTMYNFYNRFYCQEILNHSVFTLFIFVYFDMSSKVTEKFSEIHLLYIQLWQPGK